MSVNQLDSNGLQIKTNADIVAALTAAFQAIYGADINLNSNSPDGQIVNIQAQAITDLLELLVSVYNSFDLDSAFGAVLDQRCAINGIVRRAGTYTLTPVSITVDRAMTLAGLDADIDNPDGTGFTVTDGAGNNYILAATQTIAAAGTYSYSFRAQAIGDVEPQLNTITNQVTVTAGVTAVNNPLTATAVGQNEETDAQLKVRRLQMYFLPAIGPADAVRAALLAVDGITDVRVGENNTGSPSGGITANSIWAIVEGGSDADVAQAIYAKKSAGCGMDGGESVVVTRPAGDTITIKFDRAIEQALDIKFKMVAKVAGTVFDTTAVAHELALSLAYGLGQQASIDEVIMQMSIIEPDAYITEIQVSNDGGSTWDDIVDPDDIQHKFTVDEGDIAITT